jgi:hypothetical protein
VVIENPSSEAQTSHSGQQSPKRLSFISQKASLKKSLANEDLQQFDDAINKASFTLQPTLNNSRA